MSRKSKTIYIALTSILFVLTCYLFWGPLFPWNPFKFGYQKIDSEKATLYITEMTEKDSVVFRLDDITKQLENFHDLKFNANFKIIVVSKDAHMKRFLPWLSGSGYSVSLGIANVIYIGPTARKWPKGIERYLCHEMSHLLVYQNTSFENAQEFQRQGWFSEGIAEYVSGHSFYSKNEFLQLCEIEKFQFNNLNSMNPHDMTYKELKFNYTYYYLFIKFLVKTYGLQAFQNFIKNYIMDPKRYKDHFLDIYQISLESLLHSFKLTFHTHG